MITTRLSGNATANETTATGRGSIRYVTSVPPACCGANAPRILITVREPRASLKPEASARLPHRNLRITFRRRSPHWSGLSAVIIEPDLPISTTRVAYVLAHPNRQQCAQRIGEDPVLRAGRLSPAFGHLLRRRLNRHSSCILSHRSGISSAIRDDGLERQVQRRTDSSRGSERRSAVRGDVCEKRRLAGSVRGMACCPTQVSGRGHCMAARRASLGHRELVTHSGAGCSSPGAVAGPQAEPSRTGRGRAPRTMRHPQGEELVIRIGEGPTAADRHETRVAVFLEDHTQNHVSHSVMRAVE